MNVWRAAVLAGAGLVAGCAKPPCPNQDVRGVPAPDGAHIAFVFHRNCDPASAPTTDVSVMDMRTPLRSGPGNVLVLAGDREVKVAWQDARRIAITLQSGRVLARHDQAGTVVVEFH